MKIITNNLAYEESLKYFKGDDLAARVWVTKYALKDSDGNIYEKTPDDMHHRIILYPKIQPQLSGFKLVC